MDVHRPTESDAKSTELKNLVQRIKHPVREAKRLTPGTSVPLLPAIDGLQSLHRRINNRRATSEADQHSIRYRDGFSRNNLNQSMYKRNAHNQSLSYNKNRKEDVRSAGRVNGAVSQGPFMHMINHSPARSDVQSVKGFSRPM